MTDAEALLISNRSNEQGISAGACRGTGPSRGEKYGYGAVCHSGRQRLLPEAEGPGELFRAGRPDIGAALFQRPAAVRGLWRGVPRRHGGGR